MKSAAPKKVPAVGRASDQANLVDYRPAWLLAPRSGRSPATDAANLLAHLKGLFLQHYPDQTEAQWERILTGTVKTTDRQGHGDFLAKHLLGAEGNRRPLDGTVMMAFSYNFSTALGYASEAAWTCEQGNHACAWSLVADAWYFAGLCTVQAEFKHPSATTASHLANARAQRKDRTWKADVFTWCDSNQDRFWDRRNKVNRSKLAEAVFAKKLCPVTYPSVYRWVCEWAKQHETTQ
jgi:hypothetical protein